MAIKIPEAPVPVERQALSFQQVGHRWKTRQSIAKGVLRKTGIPVVYVPQKPLEGVKLTDLLAFEARMRARKEASE
jgi:hypothetical protein